MARFRRTCGVVALVLGLGGTVSAAGPYRPYLPPTLAPSQLTKIETGTSYARVYVPNIDTRPSYSPARVPQVRTPDRSYLAAPRMAPTGVFIRRN